jgi:hypothetical protein
MMCGPVRRLSRPESVAASALRVAAGERIFRRGRVCARWVTFGPVQRIRVGRGVGAAAGIVLAAAIAACGGDDVTTFILPEEDASPLEPEPTASRTFEVLSEQSSLDVVCRFIGVSSVAGTGVADRAACSSLVDDCRSNVEAALGSGDAPPLGLPPTDLEALLGCPLTLPELDGCLAAALERGIDQYGSSIGCDMPALPAVNTIALFASVDCIGVALLCPELIASLAGQ